MMWLVSLAALVGVWLNIHRHSASFAIWSVTNALWAVIDWAHGLYPQAALMAVYWVLSVYGLRRWTRPRMKGEARAKENPGRSL